VYLPNVALAQSEVCNFAVTLCIQEYVFRFQVSLENLVLVELIQDQNDLDSLEACPPFLEAFVQFDVLEEFAP